MPGFYDPTLVALSIAIAMIASYTTLDLTTSISVVRGRAQIAWLALGSLAMGTGIWSMHFTGMLAFHLPDSRIAYEARLLVLSILIAIAASALALYVVTRPARHRAVVVLAGLAMGVAIAGMHYTGMAGMRLDGHIEWNYALVFLSIAIAVTASFGALDLARRVRSPDANPLYIKLIGAVIMGVAIAGMHYTGMAAANFHSGAIARGTESSLLASNALATVVIGATVLILSIAIGGSMLTRTMTRRMESEVYFRSLIENASDLILVMDRNGTRRFVSPSYERVLGYAREEMVGKLVWDCVHPDDTLRVQAAVNELARHPDQTERISFRVRHVDGSYRTLAALIKNLLHNHAVRGFVVTAQDETERRELELKVQHAQKMEAVGRLAGGIAHDFNNLLTVIVGNMQVLSDEFEVDSEAAGVISEVQGAAQRAAGLTRQLLAFSRRQVLQPSLLQVNDLVTGIHKMIVRLLGEDIEFTLHLEPDLPLVRADAGQVEQAILNLAVNARDAMPFGGLLTISTSHVPAPREAVVPADHVLAASYVCLQVSDSGTGMDKALLHRIFEPFFTTKEVGKGTGLGLATVFGIMNQSGGYVAVDSEPERGSRFRLLFPAVVDPQLSAAVPATEQAEAAAAAAGNVVLLIEDEDAVRSFTRRALQMRGYTVIDAASGYEAIERAANHQGPIHLILSDVVLPDINGRETAERICAVRPSARVLYMSGYTEDEIIHRGAFTSGVNFLQKPFTPRQLHAKVATTLES